MTDSFFTQQRSPSDLRNLLEVRVRKQSETYSVEQQREALVELISLASTRVRHIDQALNERYDRESMETQEIPVGDNSGGSDRDLLADAFLAGFMVSGEGYNGEYLSYGEDRISEGDKEEAWSEIEEAYDTWLRQQLLYAIKPKEIK